MVTNQGFSRTEAYLDEWALADQDCQLDSRAIVWLWVTDIQQFWLRPICGSPDQRWQQCLLIWHQCCIALHCIRHGQFTPLTAGGYLCQRDNIQVEMAGSDLVFSKPASAYHWISATMRWQSSSPLTTKTSRFTFTGAVLKKKICLKWAFLTTPPLKFKAFLGPFPNISFWEYFPNFVCVSVCVQWFVCDLQVRLGPVCVVDVLADQHQSLLDSIDSCSIWAELRVREHCLTRHYVHMSGHLTRLI